LNRLQKFQTQNADLDLSYNSALNCTAGWVMIEKWMVPSLLATR
jgi:hypothetical protein